MRINRLNNNQVKKGFSLLELIIVMAVLGMVYTGVAILINRAMDNFNATRLIQNLNSIQIAMMQTFKGKGGYPEIDSDLIKSNQLQDKLIEMGKLTESDFVHTFGGLDGELKIMTSNYKSRKNGAFVVRIDMLNADQCRLVATYAIENFPYVEVVNTRVTKSKDLFTKPKGNTGTGVIRSPVKILKPSDGIQFDPLNLDHQEMLCSGDDNTFDIYVGNY